MDSFTFLCIAALVVGGLVGLALSAKPKRRAETPLEVTRWRRFRVHHRRLHAEPASEALVAEEEAGSLRILAQPADPRGRVLLALRTQEGARILEARRGGWLPGSRRWRVTLRGQDWIEARPPHGRRRKLELDFLDPASKLGFEGRLPGRELTIWRGGILIATVSWQQPQDGLGDTAPDHYFVEVLKTEDPVPPLALALLLEALEPRPATASA